MTNREYCLRVSSNRYNSNMDSDSGVYRGLDEVRFIEDQFSRRSRGTKSRPIRRPRLSLVDVIRF